MLLIVFVAGFLAAAAAPLVVRASPRGAGWLLAAVPGSTVVWLIATAAGIVGEPPLTAELPWIPAVGLNLSLRLDGLSALLAILVTGVGASVLVYAGGYMGSHPRLGRFMSFMMLFLSAMLGIVLADNLLLLYVCWELTTASSWLLIGFEHEDEESRGAAWQALMVTAAGGLAMLAGFVLLGQAAGTYEITAILAQGESLRASPLYLPVLLLVVAGAAAKSALVPLHFWLPNAMAAPTPVSAYLHSAAMVKAGIYLLARLSPVLAGEPEWEWLVAGLGAVTAVVGAWLALLQTDLKRLLAYTTIAALGMMAVALGVGGGAAAHAAMILLFAHGLYKGALFMVAGAVDHGAGSRDLREVGGLAAVMPFTAAAALLAMVSMVGLPPTLGYLAEEALVKAAGHHGLLLLLAVVLAGALYTAAGFVAVLRPLLGRLRAPRPPHEPAASLWLAPAVLGVAGVGLALAPGVLDRTLIAPAAEAVAGRAPRAELSLWHGVGQPFLLGMAMLVAGAGAAGVWDRLRRVARRLTAVGRAGPERGYDLLIRALDRGAERLDRILQHGYLPAYLLVILAAATVLVSIPLLQADLSFGAAWSPVRLHDLLLVVVILAAAAGALVGRSRVAVLAALSTVGFGVALLFAEFGGPDLAMTQVLVDTMLVALVAILLPALPRFDRLSSVRERVARGVVSVAAGAVIATLLLAATAAGPAETVSAFHVARSEEAGGSNVVNTILVSFRAADTLGEVSVLGAAALGALVLLGAAGTRGAASPRQESLVLSLGVKVILPLLLLLSVYLLVGGHHRPGGGFAAALVATVALTVHVFERSRPPERAFLRLRPEMLLGAGLAVMALSGVPALLAREPYLTALWIRDAVPVVQHLGTPLLFDVGVLLAAAGAVLAVTEALEESNPWRS